MKDYLASDVRNIVMLGHSGSGKSAICEAMLFQTKAVNRLGRAGDGTSEIDYDSEEKKRNMSVYMKVVPIEWKNTKVNFIDTPGYLDYAAEVASGVYAADNALIVVSAKEGVESGTINAFKAVDKRKLPTIFFINKIDEEHTSFDNTYNQLRDNFGKRVIPFELPIKNGEKVIGSVNLLRKKAWYYDDLSNAKEVPAELQGKVDEYFEQIKEIVAMGDEELMEKYFSGEEFDDHEFMRGLRIGVRAGEILPVYCGSATNLTGIERLLDLISEYFPSYAEKGFIEAKDNKGEVVKLETNEKEALSAFVFKTVMDPFVGRISYIKVMSGVLSTDAQLYNTNQDKVEKLNQIFALRGKNQIAIGKLFTGDIGAVVKLQYTKTNDTLCTKAKAVEFSPVEFPEPMLSVALWPKTKNDEDKLSQSLQKVEEEDMACRVINNTETKEMVLYGVGDQHIDVIINKLKERYKVEVNLTQPKVPYRETIRGKAVGEGRHKKQSGGAGQFGHVFIEFEPTDSEDLVFAERVFGGAVPRQFFPAVEAGLKECMPKGLLAGYRVVGIKATLFDGKYHEVDSKEIAFKSAAHLAFKDGIPKAKPVLLEPIVKLEVFCPDGYQGTIVGDFNKRRGIIMGIDAVDDDQCVTAEVPLAEVMLYATELRSFTQGRAHYTQTFERYDVVPSQIADKIIANAQKDKEDED